MFVIITFSGRERPSHDNHFSMAGWQSAKIIFENLKELIFRKYPELLDGK